MPEKRHQREELLSLAEEAFESHCTNGHLPIWNAVVFRLFVMLGAAAPQFSELKPVPVISDSHCAATIVKDSIWVELNEEVSDQMLVKLMRTLAHV